MYTKFAFSLFALAAVAVGQQPMHAATAIPATGANADIIVEGYNPGGILSLYASSAFDVTNGSTFIAKGIGFGGDPGIVQSFTSQSDPSIQFELLGGYAEMNALQILNGNSGSLTLGVAGAYSSIYVLTASANGSGAGTATVNFVGGTSLELAFASPDWYGSGDVAISTGPIYAGTDGDGMRGYYGNGQTGLAAPWLFQYELVIPADYQGLAVSSIDFAIESVENEDLYTSVMGLSGTAVPEPSTIGMLAGFGAVLVLRRKARTQA